MIMFISFHFLSWFKQSLQHKIKTRNTIDLVRHTRTNRTTGQNNDCGGDKFSILQLKWVGLREEKGTKQAHLQVQEIIPWIIQVCKSGRWFRLKYIYISVKWVPFLNEMKMVTSEIVWLILWERERERGGRSCHASLELVAVVQIKVLNIKH